MVALEYLPSVMSCQIGLDYLTTAVVLNRSPPVSHLDWLLEASTERGDDYVRAQCLSCAAVLLSNLEKTDHSFCQKTVASVCHYTTVTIPSFLSSLCNLLESYVETEKLIALSSLSLFATSSPSAFLSTLSFPDLLSTWLQLLRSQPSLQAPTLHSIAQVLLYPYVLNMNQPLHPNSDVPMRTALQPSHLKERVSASFVNHLVRRNQGSQEAILSCLTSFDSLKKNLFHQIGTSVGKSSTMEFLVKLAKQPIAETKLGAVDVLRSLAYQDNIWGLQTLMGNVGFYQYLQVLIPLIH